MIRLGVVPCLVLTFALQALVLGPADALLALLLTALLGLLLVEAVIGASLRHPSRGVTLLGVLLALFAWMRRTRRATWGRTPLEFEDSLPDDVQLIPISPR